MSESLPPEADAPALPDPATSESAAAPGDAPAADHAPAATAAADDAAAGTATPSAEAAAESLSAPITPAPAELSPAACAARLTELFPAVFTPGAAKPLKLRIQVDIQTRAPNTFSKRALSGFLQRHTTSTAYLKALVNTPLRSDLDGQAAGDVTDEHRAAATAELDRRRALHDARRAAEREAQRTAQREVQKKAREEQQAARAAEQPARDAERAARQQAQEAERLAREAERAEEPGRRERANLLHAFETSTLTRSNFCVLKRIPEAELEALLTQARKEREQRPAPARPEVRSDAPRRPQPPRPGPRPDARGPRPPRSGPPRPRT